MLLEIKTSKDGNEITRMFAFTPREQEIIRVRVGELAKEDDILECMFKLMKAESFLKEKYGVSESVALKIVRRTYRVMQYESIEELIEAIRTLGDKAIHDLVGAWGEWKFIQMAHEYGILVDDYQISVEEETIKI